MPVAQAHGFRQAVEQRRFGGAVRADQQQGLLVGQGGKDHRVEVGQAVQVERAQEAAPEFLAVFTHDENSISQRPV